MYTSEKILSGFSTCFRQWRAKHSNCKYLHGYALEFKLVFECDKLDEFNWCMDFGKFRYLQTQLKSMFDHTTIIAQDDPCLEMFRNMALEDLIEIRTIEHVGCEKFAEYVFNQALILQTSTSRLVSVTCIENKNNSATYKIN